MNQDEKMEVAIFRYGVISDLVNGSFISREERSRLFLEKCARKWNIPFSAKTRISKSTLKRWICLYKRQNKSLESLCPKGRSDRGKSRAMDDDTSEALLLLRRDMPDATISRLVEEMQKRDLITAGVELAQSSVYRFLHENDLMEKAAGKPVDRRKFEAELPNDIWQSDVMHGPMVNDGERQRKSYLIAIIDDHSRLIVYAEFHFSENLKTYLTVLEKALLKRGLPRNLYVDNGAAFKSKHLEYVTANLNIALIHAKPYQPQGKGKIERWFKTIRSSFLPTFEGRTLCELNAALEIWVHEKYHQRKHGGTGEMPWGRFTRQLECIRQAPSDLKEFFRNVARRKIAKDRSIALDGKLYEGPVALIGKQVECLYHLDNPDIIEIMYQKKSYGRAHPIDLHVNCRVKRDRNSQLEMEMTSSGNKHKGGALLSGARRSV